MLKFEEERLQEELISVNNSSLKLLQKNMQEDPELSKRMTTPVRELPYYHHL